MKRHVPRAKRERAVHSDPSAPRPASVADNDDVDGGLADGE